MGFTLKSLNEISKAENSYYPPLPDFKPLSDVERRQIFGDFRYTIGGDNSVKIDSEWVKNNIVNFILPALKGVPTYYNKQHNGMVICHKKAKDKILELFDAWNKEGLLKHVIFWGGCFVPRFVRVSNRNLVCSRVLSNHSWGTAFDINIYENQMGMEPAKIGEKGSVIELVPIANSLGWFWGGHFKRKDGMHFEIARL